MLHSVFRLLFWLTLSLPMWAQAQTDAQYADGDRLMGEWLTEGGKAKVKIFRTQSGTYVGKIIWLRDSIETNGGSGPNLDDKNPDEALRSKPVKGKFILLNFKYIGNDTWENGTIYDPENGSTYDCVITMVNRNKLEVRGYVGVSMFGRTTTWTR
jgi:uncharacterized protein (DUF2147 family)